MITRNIGPLPQDWPKKLREESQAAAELVDGATSELTEMIKEETGASQEEAKEVAAEVITADGIITAADGTGARATPMTSI